jgi:hypothetical protein
MKSFLSLGLLLSTAAVFAATPPTTPFPSAAECAAAFAAGHYGDTVYGAKINHPCATQAPFPWVYSSVTDRSYACVNKPTYSSSNRWFIELLSTTTTQRAVFSSSGARASDGQVFCTAIAYDSSSGVDYTSRGMPYGTNIKNDTTTYTPIAGDNDAAYIAAYGIPKYWKNTRIIETVQYSNNNSNVVRNDVVTGIAGSIDWQ